MIVSTPLITSVVGFAEPEYEFTKKLFDTDSYENETAEFSCTMNDKDANVEWFIEDEVRTVTDH